MWPFSKKQQAPEPKPATAVNRKAYRKFTASIQDRLTASWTTTNVSIDADLRSALPILRARSRDLAQNDDYGRKFIQMCETHVVGPNGFSLQVNVKDNNGKADKLANKAIENAFWDWCKVGNCDVTGKHSFFDIQRLYIKGAAREGEILIRKVYGEGKYGFQLQILDIDRLDVNKNEELSNGNIIKMGVELNRYGKPVAYWIRTRHPADGVYHTATLSSFERIPASEIYHHFIAERPEQNRGIPWMSAAMKRMNNLSGYEEAAIIAARVGASQMGFFTSPEGQTQSMADEEGPQGELYTNVEPGVFGELPAGVGFEKFDPDYPHAMFSEFVKSCLRSISSGLGVAYNTLSNDLEGVNFSSIRTGVLEERDNWMVIQRWVIENWLNDLFSEWLKMALLSGKVVMENGSALPVIKFDKFNAGTWQGRRWQWVDPEKDINANVTAINNGLKTRKDVIAEQGRDIDDVFEGLSSEEEQIQALGLQLERPGIYQTSQNNEAVS